MGVAMITGQQGAPASPPLATPSSYIEGTLNVACEAKHAVAYGFGGRDWYRADVNGASAALRGARPPLGSLGRALPHTRTRARSLTADRTLMDVYVRPWKAAIAEGGLRGLMVTHPEVSGLPMRAWREGGGLPRLL